MDDSVVSTDDNVVSIIAGTETKKGKLAEVRSGQTWVPMIW
jgi:hypothetical protein